MKKIIRELHADLEYLNNGNGTFHKHYKSHTGHSWAQWSEYQEWINYNISTLSSINSLVDQKRYRDCYILLRPVLEAYLIIKLAMIGNKYFFDLLPIKTNKSKESESDLMNRATNDPNLVNNPNLISKKLIREKGGGYKVRLIFKNSAVQNTNVFVPKHYFMAREFDPDSVYLSDLIAKNRWIELEEDKISEHKHTHRNIKNNFLDIGSLLEFFRINKFTTSRQSKAIFVHYSYLSKFIHPTVQGYETISRGQTRAYYNSSDEINKYDFFHELLILLYATFLSAHFIELQIQYFGNQPDLKLDKAYKNEVKKRIKIINGDYSFFWFIYNEPYIYDIYQYKIKKGAGRQYNSTPKIPYYVNPLARLRELSGGWSNAVFGTYHPPKILSED